MALKLNTITVEQAERAVQRNKAGILTKLAQIPGENPLRIQRHYIVLKNLYTSLALYEYMLEEPLPVIYEHFSKAIDATQSYYDLVSMAASEEEIYWYGGSIDFEEFLGLAICFGTPEQCAKAAKVEESAYRHDDEFKTDTGYALYLQVFKAIVKGDVIDREILLKAKEAHDKLPASAKKYGLYGVTERIAALIAIADKDEEVFNQILAAIVKEHHGMAKRGELKDAPEGFFSLRAVVLGIIAKRYGIKTLVDSIYLPLHLIDQ